MTKTERVENIISTMTSFSKATYHKSEILPELFDLQKEIVEVVFDKEHADIGNLKIWDVEKHLESLNEQCGHIADTELANFFKGSKIICNNIKSEISGERGENQVFKTLSWLSKPNIILRNIELQIENSHTEIDALVISPKCLTIVEVKNTSKNIFIDEEGNYFRTGEFLRWDCNISDKLDIKEKALRNILYNAGIFTVPIKSVVVFTNNRIEIQNKCSHIRTCFLNQLNYIIDGFDLNNSFSSDDMYNIKSVVERSSKKEFYPINLGLDINQYKYDFANLVSVLEYEINKASTNVDNSTNDNLCCPENTFKKHRAKPLFTSKEFKHAGKNILILTAAFSSGFFAANVIKKGGFK